MHITKVAHRLRNHAVVTTTILALVGAQTGVTPAAAYQAAGQLASRPEQR